ncbi:MAG: NAD-dependent epimerase/dehydratase family protein [Candidatus Omnitrophica bacterium]|nr:NAD-dependent epimerase/dehydratase family protein [Candidatus Omnitrophota bacterium]
MRILVTGGAGMVGSHAAEHWAQQGHEVTVLDNLMRSRLFGWPKESVEYNWRLLGALPRIRQVLGDIRSAEDVQRAVGDGVDAVLHAAAQPGVGFSIRNPQEDFSINALGTLQVLEVVRRRSPRAVFLYCSTNKVYGTNVDRLAIQEAPTRYGFLDGVTGVSEAMSVDLAGHTPYGVSKLTGELYVQDYAHTFGMRTAVFRMSCIYGIRQFGFEDQGWLAHFTISTLLHRPITIYGNGKQVRDVLYVTDVVQAFDRFLSSAHAHGVYNIGGGPSSTLSLLELVDALHKACGRKPAMRFDEWRPSDQRVYVSDIRKASTELGWAPRVSPAEGVERLVAWVREHESLFA